MPGKIEDIVKDHYSVGDLADRILAGLKQDGKDLDNITTADLSVVDEFHIGGHAATQYLLSKMQFGPTDHVLDVGSGIGGAARTIASSTGSQVTGIDLTPEYVETSKILSRLTGLDDRVAFETASALDLPFEDGTFDAAVTLHVAMNIKERDQLYSEMFRVLKPGATVAIYDVMKTNDEPLDFPVPWAETQDSSYLVSPEQMQDYLTAAGFENIITDDRSKFAMAYFDQRIASADNPPALGPHLVMGDTVREKFGNIKGNMIKGRIAPVLMTANRP
ncbi:probable sterol methyltransferase [hydrothermal vent metagenome]|uniref:Probable sterol methyltransferase n=1 Tax=hydrothermal vent metagenome TaxID=652676 RepID=A0A3B0S2G0_9ZZZZ